MATDFAIYYYCNFFSQITLKKNFKIALAQILIQFEVVGTKLIGFSRV